MSAPALSPCAALVRRGDPERFLSAMTAPPAARERLMAVYAFNLELARIPTVVSEPMLGLIRLQWWRDTVAAVFEGRAAPAHEVAAPLAQAVAAAGLPRTAVERLLDARARDVAAEPFADFAALREHLRDGGAALLDLAACVLDPSGGGAATEDAGLAFAAANWLRAAQALGARALPGGRETAVALAREGLAALKRAHAARPQPPAAARAAFRAGWVAPAILAATLRPDYDPAHGPAEPAPFRRSARLLWLAARGTW